MPPGEPTHAVREDEAPQKVKKESGSGEVDGSCIEHELAKP